jgi:hypothetical protein
MKGLQTLVTPAIFVTEQVYEESPIYSYFRSAELPLPGFRGVVTGEHGTSYYARYWE